MRPIATLFGLLALAGAAGGAFLASSAFLGAGPGVAVHVTPVALPDVKFGPQDPYPAVGPAGPFAPTFDQLLFGNLVITTDAQMKEVWTMLFARPYDPQQFDFDHSFVVWMGGGPAWYQSFGISTVEQVDAKYPGFGFGGAGSDVDPFLSVCSFEFVPGVLPQNPPPGKHRVSAVIVDKAYFDDVVFHRFVAYGV